MPSTLRSNSSYSGMLGFLPARLCRLYSELVRTRSQGKPSLSCYFLSSDGCCINIVTSLKASRYLCVFLFSQTLAMEDFGSKTEGGVG